MPAPSWTAPSAGAVVTTTGVGTWIFGHGLGPVGVILGLMTRAGKLAARPSRYLATFFCFWIHSPVGIQTFGRMSLGVN